LTDLSPKPYPVPTLSEKLIADFIQLRIALDLTQMKVCMRCGHKKSKQLSDMETYSKVPNLETFANYVKGIKCMLMIVPMPVPGMKENMVLRKVMDDYSTSDIILVITNRGEREIRTSKREKKKKKKK
jgi:hypothetical protein